MMILDSWGHYSCCRFSLALKRRRFWFLVIALPLYEKCKSEKCDGLPHVGPTCTSSATTRWND